MIKPATLNGAVNIKRNSTRDCKRNMMSKALLALRFAARPPMILPIAMATPYRSRINATVCSANPVISCNNGDKYVNTTNVPP
ncbi:hypothetical protein D3C86_2151360 [compost metagenome]